MSARLLLSVMSLCILTVFVIMVVWEFGFEDRAFTVLFGLYHHEHPIGHWESVAEATLSVALVVLLLGGLSLQTVRAHERSERRRQASDARYRGIVESVGDLIQNIRPDGTYDFVNEAWKVTLGYDDADLERLRFIDVVREDYRAHCRALFEGLMRGESHTGVEVVFVAKDGREIFVEGNLSSTVADGRASLTRAIFRDVSARKKAEDALRQANEALEARVEQRTAELRDANLALRRSEREYQHILEGMQDTFYRADREGRLVMASPSAETLLGYRPDEAIGRQMADFYANPSDRDAFLVELEKGGGSVRDYEAPLRHKDGREVWVSTNAHYHLDENGEIGGIEGTVRDITDRRLIGARLRRQTELLTTLLDNLPAHVSLRDNEGRFLFVNQALAQANGFSKESLVGRKLNEVFDEAGGVSWQDLEEEVIGTGRAIVNHEFRPSRFPGQTFLVNVLPLFDDGGEVGSALSISLDISDLKRVEEQLKLSEARLKEAQRVAKLGYWVWDSIQDRCVYCSEECARIHGLTPAEYIELAAVITEEFTLVHPDDRTAVQERFKALRNGDEIEIEYRLQRPNGEVIYVHEIARPQFDEVGNVVQEHGTILDVTALRRSEEQFRQAQKMEAIGQLTGGIAHDFNNLLAVIQGNIAYLNRKVGDDAVLRPLIEPALRATRRGASLTQRLLAFSRQQDLEVAAVDAGRLVDELAEMLRRSIGEDVEVRLELGSEVWPCEVDAGQLEQAIINLATNARDAMPDGGVLRIEVANASLVAGEVPASVAGDYVMIAVSDGGIGMTAEVQRKIFDPFFTTKDVGKGTGLGLSMVYGFITQSGGHVAVDSAPGRGAVFRLYLPRASSDEAALHEPALCGDTGRGETVLLVEDEDDLRSITRLQLDDLGYRVLDAAGGEEALALLRANGDVDLLLTDVVLGGAMNGPQIATAARAADPALKIAYMSGYPGEALIAHGAFEDDTILLRKPFERDELAHFLNLALAQG
ncbi:MAG: PAS domain S-box protein [Alphaproteobacteria bacterium]|jgi:PAS domain S-box-containing protein|nr:PAS domain S-box protein [Alphaproteobacteria bacterium]